MPFRNREKFSSLCKRLAKTYSVANVAEMFDVQVPQAVRLQNAIMERDNFTNQISLLGVTDTKGQLVTMTAPTPVAGRTNTSSKDRTPIQIGGLTDRTYEVKQTNFDVAYKYALVDAWARFPDFEARLMAAIYLREALDRLLIGWYGQSCAADTNKATNPLLQDVNTGWFYDLEQNKPANFIIEGSAAGKLTLGKGGDYTCLDHVAFDLLSLIPIEHRTGREKLLVGREISNWENGELFKAFGQTPTEKLALARLGKTYGTLEAITPAGFPDKGIMVCDPAQLQLYYQDSAVRRQMIDNPKRDQIEHYHSCSECYRIDDLDAVVAIKAASVEFVGDSTGAPEPPAPPAAPPAGGQ